jgi:hypothetical protein
MFEKNGDLDPLKRGWRCQADLERTIEEYIGNQLNIEVAASTVRNHARRLRSEWLDSR